jgi:hypothetical protein
MVMGMPQNSDRPAFAQIQVFSAEEHPDQPFFPRFVQAAPDGTFAIAGLTPGRYRLQAKLQFMETSAPLQSPAVEVNAENADETNVRLALVPGEAVTGKLEIEGPGKAENLTVRLEPAARSGFDSGQSKAAEVGEGGTFRVEGVFPEKLRARVLPLPENAYIKSVKLGDAEAPDGVLDLSRGVRGAIVKITLSRNGGQVEGAVVGEEGQPLRESLAFVFLAATADEIGDHNLKIVAAGAKFRFSALRPGKYRIIALDGTQLSGDIAGVRALFATAPEIEVHEGERIEKDVKVMALEGPDGKH